MNRHKDSLNAVLDALVRPSYRLAGSSWPFYGLFVWSGIVAGVSFALALAWASGVATGAMAAGVGIGLLAAGALALGTEIFTGREVYTFYHYQMVVLAAAAGGLALLDRPVLPCLDLLGPTLGLVQGFGRIGCFMAGCCHGRPHRWGVCYRHEHAAHGFERGLVGVRLFPIQAVESLCLFALAGVGAALVLSGRSAGTALATYLVGYGVLRFGLEFARGDAARRSALGFSEAQWTAGFVVTATVALEAAGLLPLTPWHLAALAALAVTAAAAELHRRANPVHRLLQPAHVAEVAGALAALDRGAPGSIPVAATSLGVKMSSGSVPGHEAHYALSLREGEMTETAARALGRLVVRLRHPSRGVQVVRGSHGVFHLLVGGAASPWEGRAT